MKKYHFVFDKTKKNFNLKKIFLKKYKNYTPSQSNLIIVLGGDGFMLQILKKYKKYNKPFYGINRGTFGFLMNRYKGYDIDSYVRKSKLITISPLQMIAINKNKMVIKAIAINEVSLLRQSKQTALLRISIGKKNLIKKLVSDGVLISTPAGSTAYNLSVHGPILSLNSKKLAITPISPFRPRRWKGKIISDKSIIEIKNLDLKKRPISAVADNIELRYIKKLKVNVNKKIEFKLLYDKSNSLIKKIRSEQLKKQ